ncbi:hypothetical protein HPT27_06500 [Permianibacter sp. IMCC34836]|uniref:hypothetical protein n=1 Tax=Permianibacter fluminis TaxID=2738515 RepID=UPI001555AC7A|nr:hypothetical protein [Permianibacter fluminis]NQD36669.1 hypothetical protein [Permianibacter fluminis]
MRYGWPLLALTALTLVGCGKRDDTEPTPVVVTADTPNTFLVFPDAMPALAAGSYTVVAATANAGLAGSYQLQLTLDDGSVQQFSGSWTSSAGQEPLAAGNPRHSFTLTKAGGAKLLLTSSVDAYLYLLKNDQIIAQDDNSGGGSNAALELAANAVNSQAYAEAYYRLVDPNNERTTLADWKHKNGFDAGEQVHVVFRDAKDLGYGRNMRARRNDDGSVAIFVENYLVELVPESATNYGPLNLEAAIREDRQYHVGTNAIEFSPIDPDDPDSEKIMKFFTFEPTGTTAGATQNRVLETNLDGRGKKFMPGPCLACHGGRMLPLESDGSFPLITARSAKYNALEVNALEFSSQTGYRRADLEAGLRELNEFVHGTHVVLRDRPADEAAKWSADFAIDTAAGRYGGDGLPLTTADDDYVPAGWQQTAFRPEGVELLYKRVVEPHCSSCHALQGNQAGENELIDVDGQMVALANSVNFSSYEKFMAYNDQIIDYVYRRGFMPLSLRNYESFWRDPTGAPALLASYLHDFPLFDSNGNVQPPGNPVAKPGADRIVHAPVQLDGSASLFADSYRWRIVTTPVGATAALSDAASSAPVLSADMDGDYVLELVVSGPRGDSAAAQLVLTVDSAASDQHQLTFVDDIRPLLGSATNTRCATCHTSPTLNVGIPVRYDDGNPNVYRDVLARINFADPENSRLLRKPTSVRHGGGMQIDRSTDEGRATYNTLLNWIREGAVCGNSPGVCP